MEEFEFGKASLNIGPYIAITVRQLCGNCWVTVSGHQVSDYKVTSAVNSIPVMGVVTVIAMWEYN